MNKPLEGWALLSVTAVIRERRVASGVIACPTCAAGQLTYTVRGAQQTYVECSTRGCVGGMITEAVVA